MTPQAIPGGSVVKNLPANASDVGLIPELGSLEKKMAIDSSILGGNPMDRGAWQAIVHGVAKK